MKKWIIFAAAALTAMPVVAQNEVAPAAPATIAPAEGTLSAEIKIGTGLENREVVGEAENFGTEVAQVVGWTRITGAALPTQITHVWKRNNEEISSVPLNVQSASYRTYSRKSVGGMPGNWTLEVKDAAGNVIASKDFTVGAN